MGALKLGPGWRALGTTLSQALSVAAALWANYQKRKMIPGLAPADFKPKRQTMAAKSARVALQDGLIRYDCDYDHRQHAPELNDSAAVGIVERSFGILFLVPSTLYYPRFRRWRRWISARGSMGVCGRFCFMRWRWRLVQPGYRRNDAVCGGRRGVAFARGGGHPARQGNICAVMRGTACSRAFISASAASFARPWSGQAFRFCITSSRSFARACRLPIWLPHWIKPA